MRWLSRWNRGLIHLLVVVLLHHTVAVQAVAATGEAATITTYIADLERLRVFATDVRDTLEPSRFDLDALQDTLDYDAERIIAFVRDEIHYEQYAGILRGARGTLTSRSGNAADQALLLAQLLRDAGYDARIARGSLDDTQANALLREIQRTPAPRPAIGDVDAAHDVYVAHGLIQRDDPLARQALDTLYTANAAPPGEARENTREVADFIRRQLADRGAALAPSHGAAALLEEARDYFWVQYRDGAAGAWQNLHPAFADPAPLDGLAFSTVYADSLPSELQHRLRIQLYAERWADGKLHAFPVSDPWERPAWRLLDQPITVGILPDTLLTQRSATPDIERAMADAGFFIPVIMDAIAPGAVFFDRFGSPIDPGAAQNAAAGLFGSLQNSLGDAITSVSPGKSLPSLTAQWMELTLIAPDGSEHRFRRSTLDRIGPAARATGRVPATLPAAESDELRPLLERQTVMVATGAISDALAMNVSLSQMLEGIDILELMLRGLYGPETPTLPQQSGNLSGAWTGHMNLLASLDQAAGLSERHRIYRHAPTVAIHRTAFMADGGVAEGIDVVTNPRRAIPLAGPVRSDPDMLIDVGVWETRMEGTVVNQEGPQLNTEHVFRQAAAAGLDTILLLPTDPVTDLALSEDALYHIQRDLDAGYAVLVPESDKDITRTGWWRVDPASGTTLGMLGDGRGSVITDYLVQFSGAISQAFLVIGLMGCLKQAAESGNQPGGIGRASCCIGANFLLFGVGWFGGNAVAGASAFKLSVEMGSAARAYLARTSVLFDSATSLLSLCD